MSLKITNNLTQFMDGVQVKGARGMASALILGASEASMMTPIATSTLLNSQFSNVDVNSKRVVGTVGYTAEYAAAVHDPEHKQKFRRAGAEKSFLKKGFEQAEPNIRAVLIGAIKT